MAHILLMGHDFLAVCSRFEPQQRWLDKGYKRVEGLRAADAVERAVREGATRTVQQLWREAFAGEPPEPDELGRMRSRLVQATSGHMPRLLVLRHVPERPHAPFEIPKVPGRALVKDAPPGHIMWIGFELVDQDGAPVANEPFLFTAPDGQRSTKRLNERGLFREDPTLDGTFGFALPAKDTSQIDERGYLDIQLVDSAGAPLAGAEYQICVGGMVVRSGSVDRAGRAHADALPPGPYELVLPGFEPSAVSLDGVEAHGATGASRAASTYTVKQGDTLAKVAKAHGLKSWKALYDAPENAPLRKKRPNPNRIRTGDEVKIPGRNAAALNVVGGRVTRLEVDAPVEPLTVEYTLTLAKELVDALGSDLRFELSGVSHPESLSVAEAAHQGDDVSFAFRWEADGAEVTLEAVTTRGRTELWTQHNVAEEPPKWQDGLLAWLEDDLAGGNESSSSTEMADLAAPVDVRLA